MVRKRTYLATLALVAVMGVTVFIWGRPADAESHVLKGNKVLVAAGQLQTKMAHDDVELF